MSLEKSLKLNVSSIFSFFNCSLDERKILQENLYNTYCYLEEEEEDEYLYFVFNCNEEVEENLNKLNSHDIYYTDDYIIVKTPRDEYFDKKEWESLINSKYEEFRGTCYKKALRDRSCIQMLIINQNNILKKEIAKLLEISEEDVVLYWKAFDKESETLNLKNMQNTTILSYRKEWLLEQMKNSISIEKEIYQKVLDNSFSLPYPKITSLSNFPLLSIYNEIKEEVKTVYGSHTYKTNIKGTKYPFLCASKDFEVKLSKVIKKYKLEDMDKIKTCIKRYIKNPSGAALLKYYIDKNNESQLATDYENFTESEETSSNTGGFVSI